MNYGGKPLFKDTPTPHSNIQFLIDHCIANF